MKVKMRMRMLIMMKEDDLWGQEGDEGDYGQP